MELRNTEKIIDEIAVVYKSICDGKTDWQRALPPLSNALSESDATSKDDTSETVISATNALESLQSIKERLQSARPLMDKFHKRMQEKDPITNKPRYGAQTAIRVQSLLARYKELVLIILHETFGEILEDTNMQLKVFDDTTTPRNSSAVLETIRSLATQEEVDEQRKLQEELIRQQRAEAERLAEEQRILDDQQRREEDERRRVELEREEIARHARMVRDAELRAQREAARRDQEWVDSISNKQSIEGVKEQLKILVESTANDSKVQGNAINALYTIFSQIVSHPEEPNFRRIRRDHPKFSDDIGRHPGGREFLITAGFKVGFVDEVPSFICHEPNIETDMDGWASWFDLLKATLQVIEEQMMKT